MALVQFSGTWYQICSDCTPHIAVIEILNWFVSVWFDLPVFPSIEGGLPHPQEQPIDPEHPLPARART